MSLFLAIVGCIIFITEVNNLRWRQQQSQGPQMALSALWDCYENIQAMESSQRGYLLTGKDVYLDPLERRSAALKRNLDALQNITETEQGLQGKDLAATLRTLVNLKETELRKTIELHKAGKQKEALDMVNSDAGRFYMKEIRAEVLRHSEKNKERLAVAEEDVRKRTLAAEYAFFFWLLCMGGLIFSAFYNARIAQKSLRDMAHRLAVEAMHDPLTGLPNRRYLDDWLAHSLARAGRLKESVGALYIDLDGFSEINNTLGHDAGDEALKWASEVLKKNRRASDFVARLGGDEFVVIICGDSGANAVSVAQSILNDFAASEPMKGMPAGALGASIGIAILPAHASTADELIAKADEAMYAAKDAGKNCYRVAPPLVRIPNAA